MKKIILMVIFVVFTGCTEKIEKRLVEPNLIMPSINENHTLLTDDNIEKTSVLTEENHMKQYNDMDVEISNIDSGDMIVSLILNFTRALSDDKFGILQPDKIFSNLVDFKYLELPLTYSSTSLALLELLGKEQTASIEKRVDEDNSLNLYYKPEVKNNEIQNISDMNLVIVEPVKNETTKGCKKGKSVIITDKYHDRSMASMFAKNDSSLTGFTSIQNIDNLKFRYVQKCDLNESNNYDETFILIKETVSELIDSDTDIISMSIGLFNQEVEVQNFLKADLDKTISDNNSLKTFNACIKNGQCPNKFIWIISLGNVDNNESKMNIINSTKMYEDFKHTKFITTVTGVVNDINNSMTFTQQGQQFKNAKKEDIDYFSINLPKKTLLAYKEKELKFKEASTSYATAIFSAITYNLYSLNPDLDERGVTKILQDTAYNNQCEIGKGIKSVKYNVGGNKKFPYDINCSTHRPSRVGYIVNMKGAYKEAIKQLIETHNYFFFTEGDIESSLYRDDSEIEKTKVIDENSFLVRKIKISDKNFSNMNLGEAYIVDDNMTIDFSKDKIVCRYQQKFDAYNDTYSDITFKEVTLKYKEDGRPFIAEERNLFSE